MNLVASTIYTMPRPYHRLDVLTRQLLQRVCGGDPETAVVVDLRQAGIKSTQGIGACLEMTTLLMGFNKELTQLSSDLRMCRKLWHVDLQHTGIEELVALRRLRVLGSLRLTSSAVSWRALQGCSEHMTIFNLNLLHGNPQLLEPFVAPLKAAPTPSQQGASAASLPSTPHPPAGKKPTEPASRAHGLRTAAPGPPRSTPDLPKHLSKLARCVWQMYRYHVIVLFGDVFCLDGVYVSDAEQEAAWSYAAQVASGALDSPLPHVLLPAYAAGASEEADAEHGFEDMLEHLREQRTALMKATTGQRDGVATGTMASSASEAALGMPASRQRRRAGRPTKRSRAAYWLRMLASQPTVSQLQDQWRLRQLARVYTEDSATLNEHLSLSQAAGAAAVGGSKGAAVSRALLALSCHLPMCHVAALMRIPLPAFTCVVAVLLVSHLAALPADLTLHAAVQRLAAATSGSDFGVAEGVFGGGQPRHKQCTTSSPARRPPASSVGSLGLQVQHVGTAQQSMGADGVPPHVPVGQQSAHSRRTARAGASATDDIPQSVLSALSGLARLPIGVLASLLQCLRGWVLATAASTHSALQMRETHGEGSEAALQAGSSLPPEAAPWRSLLQELAALESSRHKLVPIPVPPDLATRNTAVELVRQYHGQLPPGVDERLLSSQQIEVFLQEQDRLWAPLLRDAALAPGRSRGDLTCTPSPLVVALTRYVRTRADAVLASCGDVFMHFPYTLSAAPAAVPALLRGAALAGTAKNSAKTSSIGNSSSLGAVPGEVFSAGATRPLHSQVDSLPGLLGATGATGGHGCSSRTSMPRSTYGQRVAQTLHSEAGGGFSSSHTAAAMRQMLSTGLRGPALIGSDSGTQDAAEVGTQSHSWHQEPTAHMASGGLTPVDNDVLGGSPPSDSTHPPLRSSHVTMHHGVRHPNTATPFLKGHAVAEGKDAEGGQAVGGGASERGAPRKGTAMHLSLTPLAPHFGVIDRLVDKQTAAHALNPQAQKWGTSKYQPLVLSDARMRGVMGGHSGNIQEGSMSVGGGGASSMGGTSGGASARSDSTITRGAATHGRRPGSQSARLARPSARGGGASTNVPPPLRIGAGSGGQAVMSGLLTSPLYVGGAKRNTQRENQLKSTYAVSSRTGGGERGVQALHIMALDTPPVSPIHAAHPHDTSDAAGVQGGHTSTGIPFTSLVGLLRRARNTVKRLRAGNMLFASGHSVHPPNKASDGGRQDESTLPQTPMESQQHQEAVQQWTVLPADLSMDSSCLPVPPSVLAAVRTAVAPPPLTSRRRILEEHPVQPPMRVGANHASVLQLHATRSTAKPKAGSPTNTPTKAQPGAPLGLTGGGGVKQWSLQDTQQSQVASIDLLPFVPADETGTEVAQWEASPAPAGSTTARPKTEHALRSAKAAPQRPPRGISQGGQRAQAIHSQDSPRPPQAQLQDAKPPTDELIGELADWQVEDDSSTSAGRNSSAEHRSEVPASITSGAARSKRSTRRATGKAEERAAPGTPPSRNPAGPGLVLGEMTDEQLMNLEFLKSSLESDDDDKEGGAGLGSVSSGTQSRSNASLTMRGEQRGQAALGEAGSLPKAQKRADAAAKLAMLTPLPALQLQPEHMCVLALNALGAMACIPAVAECTGYLLLNLLGADSACRVWGRRMTPKLVDGGGLSAAERGPSLPYTLSNNQVQELLGLEASSSPMSVFLVPAIAIAVKNTSLSWERQRMVAVLSPLVAAAYTGLALHGVFHAANQRGGVSNDGGVTSSAVALLRELGVLPYAEFETEGTDETQDVQLPFDVETHQQLVGCLDAGSRQLQQALLHHLPSDWELEGVPGWCRGAASVEAAIADVEAGRLALALTAAGHPPLPPPMGPCTARLGPAFQRLQACVLRGLTPPLRVQEEGRRVFRMPPLPLEATHAGAEGADWADTLRSALGVKGGEGGSTLLRMPLRTVTKPPAKGVTLQNPAPSQIDAYSAAGSGRHGVASLMQAEGAEGGPTGPTAGRIHLDNIYSQPQFSIGPGGSEGGTWGVDLGSSLDSPPGTSTTHWGDLGSVPFMVTPHAAQAAADRFIATMEKGGGGGPSLADDALLASAGVPGAASRTSRSTTDVKAHGGGRGGSKAWYSVLSSGHFIVPVEDPVPFSRPHVQASSAAAESKQKQWAPPPGGGHRPDVPPRANPLASLQAQPQDGPVYAIPDRAHGSAKLLLAGTSAMSTHTWGEGGSVRARGGGRPQSNVPRKPAVPSRVAAKRTPRHRAAVLPGPAPPCADSPSGMKAPSLPPCSQDARQLQSTPLQVLPAASSTPIQDNSEVVEVRGHGGGTDEPWRSDSPSSGGGTMIAEDEGGTLLPLADIVGIE